MKATAFEVKSQPSGEMREKSCVLMNEIMRIASTSGNTVDEARPTDMRGTTGKSVPDM